MARSMVKWCVAVLLVTGLGAAVLAAGGCGDMPCHQAGGGMAGSSMHAGQHAPPPATAVNHEGSAGTVQAAGKPVNTRCPIMGGKINADNVQASLTRTFNGQTVAFCCGGCPGQWDKLADQDKQAKLAKAL